MKRIIMFVLLFAAIKVAGQTTGYLRFDTVKIMKQNGTCELYVINKTKDSLGLLTNVGGGLTQFIKSKKLNDSTIVVGLDTLVIGGTGGSGVSSLNNVGTGLRRVTTPNGSIKTDIYGYGVNGDSTTNANSITVVADTSELVTPSDLADGLATKLTTSDTANKWINDIRRQPGSTTVEKLKNGSWSTAFTDSVGTGGGGQTLTSDIGHLSEIKIYSPAVGYSSTSNLTNYSHTNVDSSYAPISTTAWGVGSSDYGAWLFGATSGQSISVTSPFGVVFGDSQAEGHPNLHGRLHWLSSGAAQSTFKYDYPDSVGQLSYHLRELTHYRWYNHGIGGQTSADLVARFYRDVLGVNSPNSSDGRGDRTLLRTPQIVVIIVGINDIFAGVPLQTLKDNIEWMAAQCQQNGIRCVFLNIPGDESANASQLGLIASMNEWFKSGVLDQYGASVVDYNRWWNNPIYGTPTNYKKNSLIYDGIHPSKVGYDSLAHVIYREARLPVLTKAVFINKLDPAGSPSYSRPVDITINGDAYTLSSDSATVDITAYVPDSVQISVVSSAGGGTNSGFNHILWYTTNNPSDSAFYTRKTLFSGSHKPNSVITKIVGYAPTAENGYDLIDISLADHVTKAFTLRTFAGGTRLFLGGTTTYNSAALNISANGVAIGTNGSIYSEGASSQIAALQLLINGSASNTGVGISVGNTASSFRLQSNPSAGKDQFRFDSYSGGNTSLGSDPTNLVAITNMGFGNSGGNDQRANALSLTPTINHNTSANSGVIIRGLYYNPTLTNLGNAAHNGIVSVSGNNYLNETSGNTCIGCAESTSLTAKLRVNGKLIVNTIDSSAAANMLWQDPNTGEIKKAAAGGGSDGNGIYSGSGTLPSDVTVSTGGNTLTVSGSNDNETSFSVSNTGTTSASAIAGTASGTTSVGVTGTSTSYIGVYGSSTSNTGVQGQSSSGVGVIGVSSTGAGLRGQINPTSTNAIENIVTLLRTSSSGAGANGIGGAIQYELETATNGNSQTAGSLAFQWTDATAATRTSQFEIYGVNSGTTARKAAVSGIGQWIWDTYGAGTHTGTPTGSLQVTSGGGVIEGPALAAGTFTPTLTAVANTSSPLLDGARYTRIGNIVTFSLRFSVTTSSGSSASSIRVTLPVASSFSNINQAAGTCSGSLGRVESDATNDELIVAWTSGVGGTETIVVTGQYTIL